MSRPSTSKAKQDVRHTPDFAMDTDEHSVPSHPDGGKTKRKVLTWLRRESKRKKEEAENERLREENERLREENGHLQDNHSKDLTEKLEIAAEYNNKKHFSTIQELDQEHKAKVHRLDQEYNASLEELQKEIAGLKQSNAGLQASLQELQKENADLKQSNADLQAENQSLKGNKSKDKRLSQEAGAKKIPGGLYSMDGTNPESFRSTCSTLQSIMNELVTEMFEEDVFSSDEIRDHLRGKLRPLQPVDLRRKDLVMFVEHQIVQSVANMWDLVRFSDDTTTGPCDFDQPIFRPAAQLTGSLMATTRPKNNSRLEANVGRMRKAFAECVLDQIPLPTDISDEDSESDAFDPFKYLAADLKKPLEEYMKAKIDIVSKALDFFGPDKGLLKNFTPRIRFVVYICIHLHLQLEVLGDGGRMKAFWSETKWEPYLTTISGKPSEDEPDLLCSPKIHSPFWSIKISANSKELQGESVLWPIFPGFGYFDDIGNGQFSLVQDPREKCIVYTTQKR